jgi:hypothetical protein
MHFAQPQISLVRLFCYYLAPANLLMGFPMRGLSTALTAAVSAVAFTQIASAADLPVKAPVAPVAAPYNWTGFYIGANIGGGWGNRDVNYSGNDPLSVFTTASGVVIP